MAKVSPNLTSKPLLAEITGGVTSPNDQTKTSKDLAEDFKKASEEYHVWSQRPAQQLVLHLELGSQAAFKPAFKVNLGQTQAEFIKSKILKILDRQKTELRLIHDSLNLTYISKLEDLKKIHDIEKLTHLSADLDDFPLIHIYKDYVPLYLVCRKVLADLNHIQAQLDSKKLQDILEVSSMSKSDSDKALSALKNSIRTGIKTLNIYKTLSALHVNQKKAEKDLEDLVKHSKDKKESADIGLFAEKGAAFTNILAPDTIEPVSAHIKAISTDR